MGDTIFIRSNYGKKKDMATILGSTALKGDIKGYYNNVCNILIYDMSFPITNKKLGQIDAAMRKAELNTSPIIGLAIQDILERRPTMLSVVGIEELRAKAQTGTTEGGSYKKRRAYKKKNNTKKRTQHSRTRKNRKSLR